MVPLIMKFGTEDVGRYLPESGNIFMAGGVIPFERDENACTCAYLRCALRQRNRSCSYLEIFRCLKVRMDGGAGTLSYK
jgi:hypothetical protein